MLLRLRSIFRQFQPDVAYKNVAYRNVAYKKACICNKSMDRSSTYPRK